MPQHKSAIKRVRQNIARRERNRAQRSRVRTMMKTLRATNDRDVATTLLNDVKATLDRLATKGVFKKNQVANYKGKLERFVNGL